MLCLLFFLPCLLRADEAEQNTNWSEYPASGMLLGSRDMALYVVFTYPGSQAESAGIKAGDNIFQINADTQAMFVDPKYAAQMVNGYPVGSQIIIGVSRNKANFIFKLTRESTSVPEELFPAKQGEKWGYITKDGRMFIPPIYIDATRFDDGLSLVRFENRMNGYINKMGQTAFIIDDAQYYTFSEGLVPHQSGANWGYIDKSGQLAISYKFDFVSNFSKRLALVQKDEKWGYINHQGDFVIPARYESGYDFSEGLAAVIDSNLKIGFVDTVGHLVIPCQYDNMMSFKEGLALVQKNGKEYFINKQNEILLEPVFHVFSMFSEELAAVIQDNKIGFIDKSGKLIIPFKYDGASGFFEGLSNVVFNKKYGYIDKLGKMVISPQYETASNFYAGIALVKKDGLMRYIDRQGKVVWQEKKE